MPALEKYGAQPPIELVRQVLSQAGFYDLKKLFFKRVQNTSFVAACGPPGGGRNTITPRLIRHFNLIWVPELSENAMRGIFDSILQGFLLSSKFDDSIVVLGVPVVQAICFVHLFSHTHRLNHIPAVFLAHFFAHFPHPPRPLDSSSGPSNPLNLCCRSTPWTPSLACDPCRRPSMYTTGCAPRCCRHRRNRITLCERLSVCPHCAH